MNFDTLSYSIAENGIATITIQRPDKLNALNTDVLNELSQVFRDVEQNEEVRATIVTGAGDKAFVAGADIKELRSLDEHKGRMTSQRGQQIFQSMEDTRKPLIAAVNGYALGGGAELAMACHMRIASPSAVFGLPEVGLGLIPGYGGTQRLPLIVGRARALEMILTGKQLKAEEAHAIGLANQVADEPQKAAEDLLKKILRNGPLAVQNAITAVFHAGETHGFQLEAELFGKLCDTEDAREGTSAFLEKRKPQFNGR